MWYGEYIHTLDAKDRFILPSKFRDKIRGLKEKKFYLTRGLDGCLFLFPSSVWRRLEEKLKSCYRILKENDLLSSYDILKINHKKG